MKKTITFPSALEVGNTCTEFSFFKKQVCLKKEISSNQKINVLKNIKSYNMFYGTKFFVFFKRIGESDLWEFEYKPLNTDEKIINQPKEQLIIPIKKVSFSKKVFAKIVKQLELFDPSPFTIKEEYLTMWNH